MFGASLRRCPASLSRKALSGGLSSRAIRTTTLARSCVLSRSNFPASRIAVAAFHQSAKWSQVAAAEATSSNTSTEAATDQGPITKFADLETRGLVHPNVVRTITERMGLENMTEVQTRTISEALRGSDLIGQAKTGTGKTLGFLIPVVQNIISKDPLLGERPRGRMARVRADNIRAIIISPTRELAEQIAVEARKLVSNTGIIVQCGVGGTQKKQMLQQTQRQGCHILIGTPGRLNDLLSDEYSGVAAPNLSCLVLDEADRLLETGFQDEIKQIKQQLPSFEDTGRQTMMFSATVPKEVVGLVRSTLKPGFHYIKCVRDDEEPTHHRVTQKVVMVNGLENNLPALYELCTKEIEKASTGESRPFKAIVYFSTTNEVRLATAVFHGLSRGFRRNKRLGNTRVFEIHSKLTQGGRTMAADNFRQAKSAILFSSDVTARGMDFPDVTHVIQIGLPRLRETYVHRLGRTARAGKEGEGWIFLSPLDEHEGRRLLRGLPLSKDKTLESAAIDMSQEGEIPESVAEIIQEIGESSKKTYPDIRKDTYYSIFSAFQSYRDKQGLVDAANALATYGWRMETPPPVSSMFVDRNSLRRTTGLNVGGRREEFDNDDPFAEKDPFSSSSERSSGGSRYSDRSGGSNRSSGRSSGGFGNRSSGGFGNRSSGGFGDRGRSGGFGGRGSRSGGFGGRGRSGGFSDRGRSGGFSDRGRSGGSGGGSRGRVQNDPF